MQLNQALRTSHATHSKGKDATELFKERFYLRELANQLDTLQSSAASGLRGVSAMSPLVLSDADRFDVPMPASSGPSAADAAGPLGAQVSRLAALLTRLEKGEPQLTPHEEQVAVSSESGDAFHVVARCVAGADASAIATAARAYVAALRGCAAVRNVSVRVVENSSDDGVPSEIYVHEVWAENDERDEWCKGKGKAALEAFVKVAQRQGPFFGLLNPTTIGQTGKHTVQEMPLPASWF